MMNNIIFIADLHLSSKTETLTQKFYDLLNHINADALYILGDFFEYWIGDDDQPNFHREICNALRQASQKMPIYFMPGNRDFLVPPQWINQCGVTYLKDPSVIQVAGKRLLLSHGDLFCTEDTTHMWFRKLTHNGFIRRLFLAMPFYFRKKLAEIVRQKSIQKNRSMRKFSKKMDAQQGTLEEYKTQHHAHYIIHGHTHHPIIEEKNNHTRAVIPDWSENYGGYLLVTIKNDDIQLKLCDI